MRTVRGKVDILLTPHYAESRGFNVERLRRDGLIVEPARNERSKKRPDRPAQR